MNVVNLAQSEIVQAFGGYGPVWLLVGVLVVGFGYGLFRIGSWIGERSDKVIAAHLVFTQRLSEQVERQNDILDSQSRTLAVMAETQETQGGLLSELHKLSKEFLIVKNLTVKQAGAEQHVHLESKT